MIVIGCDPGTTHSAFLSFNGESVVGHNIVPNEHLIEALSGWDKAHTVLVLEQIESFGMAVGREVFETVFWTGRFAQAFAPGRFDRLPRRIIKQHICHTARATDANIRQELLDRFGGQQAAMGTKKDPGPLHGVKSHIWAALAVAVTWFDQHGHELRPGVTPEF